MHCDKNLQIKNTKQYYIKHIFSKPYSVLLIYIGLNFILKILYEQNVICQYHQTQLLDNLIFKLFF